MTDYKLPEGDRFKDPTKFRVLGTGQGDTLYECWNSAIQLQLRAAYAAGLAAKQAEVDDWQRRYQTAVGSTVSGGRYSNGQPAW
jgi:hypothetical protein